MDKLNGMRVAVIATDGFEEAELVEPVRALRRAGAQVDVVAPRGKQIQAFRHHDKSIKVDVDRTLDDADPEEYDAVMLPGGALNADALRVEPRLQEFLREMDDTGKPMAVICHAPWELISADLVDGRKLTSYHSIQDDLRNAGARWVDQEVVVDGNLVTSRKPTDLPAFNRAMIELMSTRVGA
jgi:protease I